MSTVTKVAKTFGSTINVKGTEESTIINIESIVNIY